MQVLTINCGSSSVKCVLVQSETGARLSEAAAEHVYSPPEQRCALRTLVTQVMGGVSDARPQAVAHRIVHGGAVFVRPTLLTLAVLEKLEALTELAPLHNPAAIDAARSLLERFAGVPQIACFDTAFHSRLPRRTREYALPPAVSRQHGVRKFGFHGLSHANVLGSVSAFLDRPPGALRIVSCHLGAGASTCAIERGRSVQTSMGMTPLDGLMMGSRCGAIDPGVLIALLRSGEFDLERLEQLLYHHSGLQGFTGTQDMRDIERRAAAGDHGCRLALAIYAQRVREQIGAAAATMAGIDVVAFTGGIGEHSAGVRAACLKRLRFLGIVLDERANVVEQTGAEAVRVISHPTSHVAVLVVATDEEREMAREAVELLTPSDDLDEEEVRIAVSARHAHLSRSTLERLFGPDHVLQMRNPLAQPGQFAARETIAIVGPRGRLDGVRLIGPPRDRDQIELSRSDALHIGIEAPVRLSGELADSTGVILEGPCGRVTLSSGAICAARHVHMSASDAQRLGLQNGARLTFEAGEGDRRMRLEGVRVRVSEHFTTELHLDTDEANALGVRNGDCARIVHPPRRAHPALPRE